MTCAVAPVPAAAHAGTDGTLPHVYVVMLQPGVDVDQTAREHSERFGARLVHVYRTLGGYAAELTDAAAAEVARDPRVSGIERSRKGVLFPTSRIGPAPSWSSPRRGGLRAFAC